MHLFSFHLAMQEKSYRGLGVKNLIMMNLTFLSKKFWKLLNNPTSLLAQIYKGKYLREGESMYSASYKAGQSLGWKSILSGGDLV